MCGSLKPRQNMKTAMRRSTTLLSTLALAAAGAVQASGHKRLKDLVETAFTPTAQTVPAAGTAEFAFSPNEGADALVLKTINSSQREIRMLAYALTSAPVVNALIAAKGRGVDVRVVADAKQNTGEDRSGKARAALGALANAGVPLRTISAYSIHHDKVLIGDQRTVQTGSYNYTQAAAKSNSENVIVLWNNPALAQGYLKHWERNWSQGRDFHTAY
jgi:phosphatidylserine/phosphatidylglycerophosphate/cardiolipin synthase-like enzyme